MSAGESETPAEAVEQELAARLASFDELLKAGDTPHTEGESSDDAHGEAFADLQRAQDCLRLLEAVWPRGATSAPTLRGGISVEIPPPLRPASAPAQLGRFVIRRGRS